MFSLSALLSPLELVLPLLSVLVQASLLRRACFRSRGNRCLGWCRSGFWSDFIFCIVTIINQNLIIFTIDHLWLTEITSNNLYAIVILFIIIDFRIIFSMQIDIYHLFTLIGQFSAIHKNTESLLSFCNSAYTFCITSGSGNQRPAFCSRCDSCFFQSFFCSHCCIVNPVQMISGVSPSG